MWSLRAKSTRWMSSSSFSLYIILAAMSVGIAVFGFIGWQKIQDIIEEKIEKRVKTQYYEQSKYLLDESINEAFAERNISTITKKEILDKTKDKYL